MSVGDGKRAMPVIEMWGGVECTVNRVGDRYMHQLERNGHEWRIGDLDAFAALGLHALRYPVLWERMMSDGEDGRGPTSTGRNGNVDFRWSDERLGRLRQLGVRPIATLVHHGSGPRGTSLIAPDFAPRLAAFAAAVARRYPWVADYTPINEPLTTARFSGLYGHWYPHGRDHRTFARALVNECLATTLAMRAIRRVRSDARLVQTEDFGQTFTTPELASQGALEGERRLLGFDLLCGRVDEKHLFYRSLLSWGIAERELAFFREAPCPPDIIGVNYYLTSDRLLDTRMERYPAWSHGGNDSVGYADVEAVRGWGPGIAGHLGLLERTWRRYGIPLAITEAHLGSTRDEQIRWLAEAWDACVEAKRRGVDVRALTAWSLLGAFDWDSLVTREANFYEPGVFDIRSGALRPTLLAGLVRALATGQPFDHPALESPGWWRRGTRFFYPPVGVVIAQTAADVHAPPITRARKDARVLLIAGGTGTLGHAFVRESESRALPYVVTWRQRLDIADPVAVDRALQEIRPWAVVNAAGFVRVDDAEEEPERCRRENVTGPATLAAACQRRGLPLVTFSSDLVFDGASGRPYVEHDAVAPLSVYGQTKAEAESRVLTALERALVIRTSAFFGPWDAANFAALVLQKLARGERVFAASDQVVSPTYVPDLAATALDLLLDGERGIWHLANQGALSWASFARACADMAGADPTLIEACDCTALGLRAPRPPYSALGSARAVLLPALDDAIARFLSQRARDANEPANDSSANDDAANDQAIRNPPMEGEA